MTKQNIVRITTVDTEKTYEITYGMDNKDIPQLWEVSIGIACVDPNTGQSEVRDRSAKSVYVERETLEAVGLVGVHRSQMTSTMIESAESLILRLLEHVGVYPNPE